MKNIGTLWKAVKGSLKMVQLEDICLYDSYVSFDPKNAFDSTWVVEELLPALEGSRSTDEVEASNPRSRKVKLLLYNY